MEEWAMNTIEYLQIYSDSDGCSHFKTLTIDLKSNDYAPPAIPLNTSSPVPAETSLFLELPVGWFKDQGSGQGMQRRKGGATS